MTTFPEIFRINLSEQASAVPADSILSRTVYSDAQVQAILFSFAAGQELSEHTAAVPTIIHILAGEGTLTLGAEAPQPAGPGTWAHLPARLPHAVEAHTPLTMLLLMLRGGEASKAS
ncbi:MAG: cupin domain-containing protein [Anaerolineales bacterium]|nr:cupin domain-containing protein [Anaerolineales bacterium]